jgi:hypothetical protein
MPPPHVWCDLAHSSIQGMVPQIYFNEDASRLLAVPPECHQHAKDLEAECLLFVQSELAWGLFRIY